MALVAVSAFCAKAIAEIKSPTLVGDPTSSSSQGMIDKYPLIEVKERSELSQYGITWKFAQPVKSGQFVTGDWWVIGPVTVVSVTPMPTNGPLEGEVSVKDAVIAEMQANAKKSPLSPAAIRSMSWVPPWLDNFNGDNRMRNGSIVMDHYVNKQGYDSRISTYDSQCSVAFPYQLQSNRTIISSISLAYPVAENFCHKIMWKWEKTQRSLLRAAAVLTCLEQEMSGNFLKAFWEKKNNGWHMRWEPNPKPDPKEVAEHLDAIHKAFPEKYP